MMLGRKLVPLSGEKEDLFTSHCFDEHDCCVVLFVPGGTQYVLASPGDSRLTLDNAGGSAG